MKEARKISRNTEQSTSYEVIGILLQVASFVALILFTYGLILLLFALPQYQEKEEKNILEQEVGGPKLLVKK